MTELTQLARLDPVTPGADAEPPAGDCVRRELAAAVEAATIRWSARQRETLASLSALLHAVRLSRDPVRTAEAWMDWQARALRRLAEDARDQRDISLALARCCGDGRLLEPADVGTGDAAAGRASEHESVVER